MTRARDNARRVVRNGYDAAAESYLADRPRAAGDMAALGALTARVPRGGRVLDLGCGAGVPVTEHLIQLGYAVAGLDLKTTENWGLVEGRGKRAFVPPDDPRHPRNAHGPPVAA